MPPFEVVPSRTRSSLFDGERLPSRRFRPDVLSAFSLIPEDVLALMLKHLGVKELLAFAICAQRFRATVMENEQLWEDLFEKRFGSPSKLHQSAHKLAGSWLKLYAAKAVTDRDALPWRKPSQYELQAALQDLAHNSGGSAATTSSSSDDSCAANNQHSSSSPAASSNTDDMSIDSDDAEAEADELCVVFLVDGSGSVGEEDFTCMTNFLETAGKAIAAVPRSKVSIVQFSNDTRVEVPLGPWEKPAFEAGIKNMVRMNGGTNIAAAVAKAGSLFKSLASCGASTRRVLVLLTDGRIDSYQAKEAGQMVAQLADEQANVGLWAFGVGRGVDAPELMRIIEGPGESAKGLGKERYVELCVRDDAPW